MATIPESPVAPADKQSISFRVNGRKIAVTTSPIQRLSRVLREDLGLTGTKVGCDAGDCGACTVLLEGEPVCACLVAVGQVAGCEIITVEGLPHHTTMGARLQQSFLRHGAAQCGACTPGMLVAATALLEEHAAPTESEVMDALGGVLCRCTGYRKIISAVLDAGSDATSAAASAGSPGAGNAVGQRLIRLDGKKKVDGTEIFGADEVPAGALTVRVIRSPYHRARLHIWRSGCVRPRPSGDSRDPHRKRRSRKRLLRSYSLVRRSAESLRTKKPAIEARRSQRSWVKRKSLRLSIPAHFPVVWEELPALKEIDEALAPERLDSLRP